MDKVTKQRDPKRQAAGRTDQEKYMAKLKGDILKNVGSSNGGSSSSNGRINTTNDSTTTTSSGSTITYNHDVGAIAVLSLGVCIFIIPKLMTNQTTSRPQNKSPEKISKEPEKISKIRRKML